MINITNSSKKSKGIAKGLILFRSSLCTPHVEIEVLKNKGPFFFFPRALEIIRPVKLKGEVRCNFC